MEVAAESEVTLRPMRAQDIAAARELSREQRWPHRTADWTYMLKHGRGTVAEQDGKVVGTIMCWPYGDDAATLGMVIVSRKCQGHGLGGRLMAATLDALGGRTVFLNSTVEGFRLYEKLGFRETGKIFQHQGTLSAVPLPELRPNERVRPMGRSDHARIVELDAAAKGMDRRQLIESLIGRAQGVILDSNTEVGGFSLFRRFGLGYVIGPTVAADVSQAKALISHWLGATLGSFCRIDVPESSGLSEWLDELGLHRVGQVTTMVRGRPPEPHSEFKLYSLVSQALG